MNGEQDELIRDRIVERLGEWMLSGDLEGEPFDLADAEDQARIDVGPKVDSPLRILVIEDSPLERRRIEESLADLRVDMVYRWSGLEGVEALSGASGLGRFDLVLLDYELPDLNGLGVLNFVRQYVPKLPVVVVTAHGGDRALTDGLYEAGASAIVHKPYRSQELRAVVQSFVMRAQKGMWPR